MSKDWIAKMADDQAPLTNKKMEKLFPLYVEDTTPDDHKCKSCAYRVIVSEGDKADCTLVIGGISLAKGTCSFWAKGDPASTDKIAPKRMDYELSGYVEAPSADFKINCGSCNFAVEGYCELWHGTVNEGNCCLTYDNDQVQVPKTPKEETK